MAALDPLPCPGRRACAAATRRADVPAEALFRAVREALVAEGADATTVDLAALRVDAVFDVAFLFKDDVAVRVEPDGEGAARLHVRSQRRTRRGEAGRWDLGTNRRRVAVLLRAVAREAGPLHEG